MQISWQPARIAFATCHFKIKCSSPVPNGIPLASTLLKPKMTNWTPYGLVDFSIMRMRRHWNSTRP